MEDCIIGMPPIPINYVQQVGMFPQIMNGKHWKTFLVVLLLPVKNSKNQVQLIGPPPIQELMRAALQLFREGAACLMEIL